MPLQNRDVLLVLLVVVLKELETLFVMRSSSEIFEKERLVLMLSDLETLLVM